MSHPTSHKDFLSSNKQHFAPYIYFSVYINKVRLQKSILPPTKEIQTLLTAVAVWLHSLFSWDLQDTPSDMPSWRFSRTGFDGTLGNGPSKTQSVWWSTGTECANGTGRIRLTRPAQVSSYGALVTVLPRCDFQGSSRYFSERSALM